MHPVVLPALIPDIEKVYDAYFAAFQADSMGNLMLELLFPGGIDDAFRKAHTAGTLQWWHHSTQQYTFKCVDTDTGNVIGMMLCDLYYKERTEEERKAPEIGWLQGEEKEKVERVLLPLHQMREKLWAGRPFIYCHVIAVHPDYQGHKAGAAICQWGLDLSDMLRLPIYLEASPNTAALYEKFGYQRLKEKIVHDRSIFGTEEDIAVPLMVRFPTGCKWTFEEWAEKGHPYTFT